MMPFDIAEYRRRIAYTKQRMEEAGIEVLLCTDPANMNYLTGYDGWSFYVPQLVVIALDQEEPIWIGRGMDANGARATTFLKSANIVSYPDGHVHSIERHPMNFVAEELARRGWGRSRIGVEMDCYYFSPMGYEALRTDLPNAKLTNSNALVNWVRSVKSPAEIALMDQAARILERVMAVAIEMMVPGQRQCDVVAAIVQAQIRGTEEFGGDYTSIVPMLPTGIGTSAPHLTWSDERFVAGEATILELAACRRRYHCPMARTVSLGKPPQRVSDAAEIVIEGLHEALSSAKPGVTCEEVEAAWRRTITKRGLVKESRLGYSTGLNYPPDWGEHTMSLRPGDRTPLQPNMTFHMIAGIWQDDWGIEISESFQVTETGARPFADVPRRMFVNG